MEPIVVDRIPFDVGVAEILRQAHVAADSEDAQTIGQMVEQAAAIARPKAMFTLASVEAGGDDSVVMDGVAFTSRVLRVNLDGLHRAFPFLATCGRELDEWSVSFDDMLEAHWADQIKQAALGCALKAVNERMAGQYQLAKTATMNPGSLPDWPITQQRPLFTVLGDPTETIGVRLTDSFLMVPNKSVSGVRFETDTEYVNCRLCPRPNCSGRAAPYDEGLFERVYRR